eukprot:TRINITY_DN5465_c0_g1_i1.p1 TRINITY_DN5465_c0_g1~~TRINITY_DN5465_c0_g1_i1.p1  ORF type:complete len:112 (+),score=11.24 TRINITY_DN5465_c0_g1_i1:80-415(+)
MAEEGEIGDEEREILASDTPRDAKLKKLRGIYRSCMMTNYQVLYIPFFTIATIPIAFGLRIKSPLLPSIGFVAGVLYGLRNTSEMYCAGSRSAIHQLYIDPSLSRSSYAYK